MFQWLRLIIVPELRAVPVEEHTHLMAAGVLRALTDAHVHLAGFACSLCAGVGAIAGGRLIRGVLHSDLPRFFGGLFVGALVGGLLGGVIYALVLLARTRPHVRAAIAAGAHRADPSH
jgi:hypothetical protein